MHHARGDLDRAQQLETELGAELAKITATLEREPPASSGELDAEARPPSAPATRSRRSSGIPAPARRRTSSG